MIKLKKKTLALAIQTEFDKNILKIETEEKKYVRPRKRNLPFSLLREINLLATENRALQWKA